VQDARWSSIAALNAKKPIGKMDITKIAKHYKSSIKGILYDFYFE